MKDDRIADLLKELEEMDAKIVRAQKTLAELRSAGTNEAELKEVALSRGITDIDKFLALDTPEKRAAFMASTMRPQN